MANIEGRFRGGVGSGGRSVVIKIGGSLFARPDLIERLEWLLAQRADFRAVLICGGGLTADLVRRWQSLHTLADEQAHWLALRAMGFNEALLQSALPQSEIADDAEQLADAWSRGRRPILCCERFLRLSEPASNRPLPQTWEVTSDSIAAWCSRLLKAEELILAKSASLRPGTTVEDAARQGLVDAWFSRESRGQRVAWANLAGDEASLSEWL